MGKTNAEICKNYYNRKKAAKEAEKIRQGLSVKKPIKKTGAERARTYRLRKKLLSQLATTSASTNRPDVSTVSSTGIADHDGDNLHDSLLSTSTHDNRNSAIVQAEVHIANSPVLYNHRTSENILLADMEQNRLLQAQETIQQLADAPNGFQGYFPEENPIDIEHIKIEKNENNFTISDLSDDYREIDDVTNIKTEILCYDEKNTIEDNTDKENSFSYDDTDDPLSISGTSFQDEDQHKKSRKTPTASHEQSFQYVNIEDIKLDLRISNGSMNRASVDRNNYTVTDNGREKCYSCNLCSLKCRYKSHMDRHMMQHTGERPYACNLCSAKFTHRGNLNGHMRIHTGEKPYTCDICFKEFREKSNIRRHMRIHTGEKPYVCEVCSSGFREKKLLNIHMRIHTGKGSFACVTRDAKFRKTSSLEKHVRIHTENQFYVCNICFTKFDEKAQRDKHMMIHEEKKRHSCSVCSLKFFHKGTLTNHMKIHSGEKPFGCSLCSINFQTNNQLNKHLLIHNLKK